VPVSFSRIYLAGSIVIGSIFALVPTLLLYVVVGKKLAILLVFFPFVILMTRIMLWCKKRAVDEHADTIKSRYESGRIPLGK